MNKEQKHDYEKNKKCKQNNEHDYEKNRKCKASENHEHNDEISINHQFSLFIQLRLLMNQFTF